MKLARRRNGQPPPAQCVFCDAPLGRFHTFVGVADMLLSRLTQEPPLHPTCALAAAKALSAKRPRDLIVTWSITLENPRDPAGTPFNDGIHAQDWLHLKTPAGIAFLIKSKPATYEQIEASMLPVIREAMDKAQGNTEQLEAITHQIAWLHHFLPKATSK